MDAEEWDARYRATELVWGAEPNRWVRAETEHLMPGRALDLACGEGRNAVWLAARGWSVTAVDFSAVAVGKGAQLWAGTDGGAGDVEFRCADATTFRDEHRYDLVIVCYLQLPAGQRRAALHQSAAALGPGGVLLVVGHDSRNLTDGVGGPQDAAVLFTPEDVVADLAATAPDLIVDRAAPVLRPVEGADRDAIDALVRMHRPG